MAKKKQKEIVVYSGDDLGAVLASIVAESGLSRYAIAKAAEMPESSLSRALSGERKTTWELLKAVCDGLELGIVVQVSKSE